MYSTYLVLLYISQGKKRGNIRRRVYDGNTQRSTKICTFYWWNCEAKPTYKCTFQLPLKIPLAVLSLSLFLQRSRKRNRKSEEIASGTMERRNSVNGESVDIGILTKKNKIKVWKGAEQNVTQENWQEKQFQII